MDPTQVDANKEKLLKVPGILHQTMGDTNHQLYVSSTNKINYAGIWAKLMNDSQSQKADCGFGLAIFEKFSTLHHNILHLTAFTTQYAGSRKLIYRPIVLMKRSGGGL